MNAINFFKKISSKQWGVIGVILTIIFACYQIFWKDKVSISFQIINQSNVLDVHTKMDDLKIIFRGDDLYKNEQNLMIYTIKIINDGDIDILQSHYDENLDWGIKINGGTVIDKPKIVSSNYPYLFENINPSIDSTNRIIFNKIIFEKGKYITFDVLVLHSISHIPTLTSFGKIAGIESIEIKDINKPNLPPGKPSPG
jgi:hypothetical protein